MDQKACLQVEFLKDSANINEALDEIVSYCEFCQSGQPQRDHSSKAFGQPPKPKESLNRSAPTSTPVDPVVQMKSIISAETEKCLNSMRELFAKQGQNKEDSQNGRYHNGQTWNGNQNDQQGNQRGQGRHNVSGKVQCYNCQGYGHVAKECQNLRVP